MADQIVIEYVAKVDKLQSDLRKVEQSQMNIDKGAKKSNKTIRDESEKAAKGVQKVEKNVNLLDGAFKKVGAAIAGVFAVGQIIQTGKKIIETTAQFQKFEAVLVNTLGSKSEAQAALAMIKDFASKTPFSVAELTESFVKLANQGFKPTQDEMRKLGDIAASQGKSFGQLTEAIIDAQTGEFERLKEFGIRASKEGDKVKFTFKGVQTQTDFTSDSIQQYILGLGDAAGVSGSMAAISNTVGGQISNLGDSFDSLYNTIGSGNSGAISTAIKLFADLVQGLELALTTTDQLEAKFKQMEATAREERFFGFLEEDVKDLVKIGTDEAEARRLVFAAQIIEIEKDLELNRRQLEKHQDLFGQFLSDPQKQILQEFQDNIDFSESALKRLEDTLIKIDKEQFKESKKTQAEIDKEFKMRLDLLKKQEELAIRRAKLEGKTEGEIIRIQESFNGKRISLFKEFEKTKEIDYQEFFVIAKELEKDYTDFLKGEEKKRLEEIQKHRDLILSEMDISFKEESTLTKSAYNDQLKDLADRYMQGQITKEQFEKESADMVFNIQKEGLKNEIDLINQKLNIENLTHEQRIDLEQALVDKKKELNDLELADFNKKEDEKKAKAKETIDKIKEITQLGIDIIGKALQGLNDLELARTISSIEDQRFANEEKTKNELESLEKRSRMGLISETELNRRKERIAKDAARKESELKRRQYQAEQNAAINRINIDTAVAVVKNFAQLGFIPAIPINIATVASALIQKALVRAQPVPKFKDGVIDYKGKGTTTSDSNTVQISNRESIIKAKQSMKHKDALTAINEGYFEKYANINFVEPALKKERERVRKQEMRAENMEGFMKSMQLNGLLDTSHLERLTKSNKKVQIGNYKEIANEIAKVVTPKPIRGL